jgi:hypothetical protein
LWIVVVTITILKYFEPRGEKGKFIQQNTFVTGTFAGGATSIPPV